jgi:hypothetical protein
VTHRLMARGLLLVVLFTGHVPQAWATVEVPVEFGEMVLTSQFVVHGHVVGVRSQQTGSRRTIETVVTVAVADSFKGSPGSEVSFRVPGGEVGRYRRVMVGAPRFTEGDEVIVFLRGAAPALPTVFGLGQGLFRVARSSDGRAVVAPAPLAAPAFGAERIVRGDPARRGLALEAFARDVRSRLGARP